MTLLSTLSYSTSIPLIILFAAFPLYSAFKSSSSSSSSSLSHFLSAHRSQPISRVIYSLISTSIGAWILFTPSSYCLTAGYVGLISYAISSGATLLIPSVFGPKIQKMMEEEDEVYTGNYLKEKDEIDDEEGVVIKGGLKTGINQNNSKCNKGINNRETLNIDGELKYEEKTNHSNNNNEGINRRESLEINEILKNNTNEGERKIGEKSGTPIMSLSTYVDRRYGRFSQYLISSICLFSMMIGLIAEYTAIGDLFEFVVGGDRIVIVILIGTVTSLYTAYGGLSVSIITDQLQGMFVLVMNLIFAIYIMATFELDTSKPLPPNLDANKRGYSAIVALPIGLAGSVIFSEAFWQRAWIATSEKDLKKASMVAGFVVTVTVFLFGFYGFIAAWNGMPSPSENLALFAIFQHNQPTWMIVVLVNMAVIMNESAVDSYQIGIVSSISSCFLKSKPLYVTQMSVVAINIPLVFLSLQSYSMMSLFLSANLITACGSIPLLLGLYKPIRKHYDAYNLIGNYKLFDIILFFLNVM